MITVLAFAVDGLLAIVQNRVTPYPLRRQGRQMAAEPVTNAAAWQAPGNV